MDLRQIYGDLAKQIVAKEFDFEDSFSFVSTELFYLTVQVENALNSGNNQDVQDSLAKTAAFALQVLEIWNPDWCLRQPKIGREKYKDASILTAPLRYNLTDMVRFHKLNYINSDVKITLELFLKRCIELSYVLDFDLAMSLFKYLRED